MIRKLAGILLSVIMVVCSIGFHVIEHHCIWCGGDRIEFVAIGIPGNEEEEQCSAAVEDACCSHEEEEDSGCHEHGCCKANFLTLQTGLVDEGGFDYTKSFSQKIDFQPVILTSVGTITVFRETSESPPVLPKQDRISNTTPWISSMRC